MTAYKYNKNDEMSRTDILNTDTEEDSKTSITEETYPFTLIYELNGGRIVIKDNEISDKDDFLYPGMTDEEYHNSYVILEKIAFINLR